MHMTHKELVNQVSENLFMQSGKIERKASAAITGSSNRFIWLYLLAFHVPC